MTNSTNSDAERALEAQLRAMRAAFHVNMMRAHPGKSHTEVSAEIDKAIGATSAPADVAANSIDTPEFQRLATEWASSAEISDPDWNPETTLKLWNKIVAHIDRARLAALGATASTAPDASATKMLSGALNHARDALRYYAEQEHFIRHQPDEWDTVSGEPSNLYEDSSNTATVEDGTLAKNTLNDIAGIESYASGATAETVKAAPVCTLDGSECGMGGYCNNCHLGATEKDALLKTWPERIWLQWNPDELEEYPGISEDLTWCADNINDCDVEYVRADLAAIAATPEAP